MQEYLKDIRIQNAVIVYTVMSTAEVQEWLNELTRLVYEHFSRSSN